MLLFFDIRCLFRIHILTSHVRKVFNQKFYLIAFSSFLLRIRNPKLISSFKSRCCKSLKLAHKYFRTHKTFNVHYIFSTIRSYHYIFEWYYYFCKKSRIKAKCSRWKWNLLTQMILLLSDSFIWYMNSQIWIKRMLEFKN